MAPTLLFCLGLHGIYSNSLYDVGKDLWYFSGPVVYITFGYLVFERLGSWQRLVQPLVIIGAYSCLVTIVRVVQTGNNYSQPPQSKTIGRSQALGTFVLVLPTVLLALMRHVGLPTIGVTRLTAVRATTYILSTIAVLVHIFQNPHGMPGCRASSALSIQGLRQEESGITRCFSWAPQSYWALASSIFHSDKVGVLLESFVQKTANTSSEVNVHSYETFEDINPNWRGFEASRAAKTYGEFGDTEKLFGGGFGTKVDLGFAMKLV